MSVAGRAVNNLVSNTDVTAVALQILIEALQKVTKQTNETNGAFEALSKKLTDGVAAVNEGARATSGAMAGVVGQLAVMSKGGLSSMVRVFGATVHQLAETAASVVSVVGKIASTVAGMISKVAGVVASIAGIVSMASKVSSTVISLFSKTAGSIVKSIGEFSKITAVFSGITAVVGKVASAVIGAFTQIFAAVLDAVGQLVSAVANTIAAFIDIATQVVDLFRPDVIRKFTMATNDMLAVFGEVLTPVMQAATDVVKMLGDVFASGLVVMKPLFKSLVGAFKPLTEVFVKFWASIQNVDGFLYLSEIIQEIGRIALATWSNLLPAMKPVIVLINQVINLFARAFLYVLQKVSPVIIIFANVVGKLVRHLVLGFDTIMKMLGVNYGVSGGSSYGKAARQATFTSSDEIYKDLVKSAFGAGRGETEDPMLKEMNNVSTTLRDIYGFLKDNVKPVLDTLDKGRSTIQELASNPMDKATSMLTDMARTMVLKRF